MILMSKNEPERWWRRPVPLHIIIMSYFSSLIANVIVMLGAISIFVWLKEDTTNTWIRRHRNAIMIVGGILFMLFVQSESWTNAHLSTVMMGFHWTYLNLELIALYNFTLQTRTRWQLLSTLGLTTMWFVYNTKTYTANAILFYVLVIVVEIAIFAGSRKILHSGWLYFGGLWLLAASAFKLTTVIYAHQDLLSWVRQISALLILQLGCFLYGRSLLSKIASTERKARFDELTGIHNFATFNQDLEQLFDDFKQNGHAYAIYCMDIDWFKRINDTYGHVAGNDVLRAVAQCLSREVESVEYEAVVYRTGGEEFTVILKNVITDPKRAAEVSLQLQRAVRKLRFDFAPEMEVHISIGQERVVPSDTSYLETYKRADKYLYTSKRSGRNRITVRGETLAEDV